MKKIIQTVMFALMTAACGGEDTSNPNNNGNMNMQQQCAHSFQCLNGSCACSSGPRKDNSCCDPEAQGCSGASACNSYCNVCS